MTTIVYKDGIMAADSCGIVHRGELSEHKADIVKLRMTRCKRAIVGLPGPMLAEKEFHDLMPFVMDQLTAYYLEGQKGERDVKWITKLSNNFMILTTVGLFVIGDTHIYMQDSSIHLSMGTGAVAANIAVSAGRNAIEAVEFAIKQDLLSGGEIKSYSARSLKPFIRKPPVDKAEKAQ